MQEIQIEDDSTTDILNARVSTNGYTIRLEKIPEGFWEEALKYAMEYPDSKLFLKKPVITTEYNDLILMDEGYSEVWIWDGQYFVKMMYCEECGREDLHYEFSDDSECKGCRSIAEEW